MITRFQRTITLFLPILAAAGLGMPLRAATTVHLGTVKQFSGPADPNLDLAGFFEYAVNFSSDDPVRTVAGVNFQPDNQPIPGVTITAPQNVTPWQSRPEYGSSADADALEEIMADIRWANSGGGEKLQATLAVKAGVRYKIQVLISGNTSENRRWDIRLNGQQAVDEITSLGASPGNTYAAGRSTVWACEFVPAGSTATVEMGSFFGGNDGGDRNPIWQALTLERVEFPPTPDNITLSSSSFFPSQTLPVGAFTVTDQKYGVTHTLSLAPGEGSADNAKFTVADGQLLAAPFDFSSQADGATYSIRVRAVDKGEPARLLEKTFALSLAAPHAPVAVTLDATSLSRGLVAGQLAGLLTAADPDAFDRHVFSLVAGAGDSQNAVFTITGNTLSLASALPDGLTPVSLRLRAVDLSGLAVESVLTLPVVEPKVRINEVLAVPTPASRPLDQKGEPRDWIELYNEQAQPVSLAGWHLSDDPQAPDKWAFPATASIPPQGYYLVFTSGSGATPASGAPHTSFSLSQDGERLVLSRPDGLVMSDVTLPRMFPNVTWGNGVLATEVTYLMAPTPNAANAHIAAAGSNEVIFSVPHGFKTAAFPLTLSSTFGGNTTIRYTLDGTKPTASSPVYSGPITVTPATGTVKSGTRIVRAVATNIDIPWSPVATQSYFFVNGITAPATDGVVGQSNFINSIRNNAVYGPLMDDALLALPAVSLVINNSSGLPSAETESSLELFDPQGGEAGFTVPAGVVRSGTSSLNFAKGSMSARFRGKYGASKLDYPVYARHPHDAAGAATSFQELRLRSGSHDTHSWLAETSNPSLPYGSPAVTRGGDAQYVRNIWVEDTQLLMGQPGKHGRMVNMFVNGNYYGMYHIQEHADDDYMASYYPGNSDDYHFTGGATTGSDHDNGESWRTIWSKLKASLSNWTQAKRWVDVTNLADYMVLSFYIGNDWDWTTQHNWGAAGPRLPDQGGWKFFEQDQDVSLQDVNADCTDQTVPDNIFHTLMSHADFKVLFRDRIYRHLFNNGVLTPAKASGYYQLRANEIATAIVAETARWQPGTSAGTLPWDRNGEWTVEKNYLVNTFFPQRTAKLLTQLRARGWYPVNAPEMSQHGGTVDAGAEILLTGPAGAAIYYTLDGSDPRLPGGAVNPAAFSYTAALGTRPLVEAHDGVAGRGAVWKYLAPAADPGETWKNTAYDDSSWSSGAAALGYGGGGEVTDVGGADIDPATPGEQRNITTYFRRGFQIENPSAVTGLNLRLKRDDGAVVYLNGREVFRSAMPAGAIGFTTPGNSGANVSDDGNTWFPKALVPADFTLVAGTNVIAVEIHNAFSGSSDLSFDLELTATLPLTPQPIVLNAAATLKTRALSGTEWSGLNEASFALTGTQPASPGNVVISEIHYHPEGDGQGDNEFVEFLNTAAVPVSMDGVRLGEGVTFTFPAGVVLSPGERIVVVKDAALFDARYRTPGTLSYHAGIRVAGVWEGSLSNGGESLALTAADHAPILAMTWQDSGSWPGDADGGGPSLELSDPAAAPLTTAAEKGTWLSLPGPWRASSEPHGTPGYAGAGPAVSGYAEWAAAAFPANTPAADLEKPADPDRDGLVNLLEFALGLNPISADPPPITIIPGTAAGGAPEFQFNLRANAAGLTVKIQVSNDLSTWDSSETAVERVRQQPNPGGTTRITVRLRPAPAETRRYLRLAVSL
ncbi:MAG: lamin tail domain-containing protein [Verrucomicrobiota bacterium]